MNTLPIIIIGAGGHAKVLVDALLASEKEIIGIVDRDGGKLGSNVLGIPVIGDDSTILNYSFGKVALVNGIGSIKHTNIRKSIYEKFKLLGYSFSQVVHPSAIIAEHVTLREGVQVMAGVVIQAGSSIEENSIINTRSVVDHDCVIGEHVHIAPGTVLSGGVTVGSSAHIGTGCVIVQNIKIGARSVLGAGSVVVADVSEDVIAFGNPARLIKQVV